MNHTMGITVSKAALTPAGASLSLLPGQTLLALAEALRDISPGGNVPCPAPPAPLTPTQAS